MPFAPAIHRPLTVALGRGRFARVLAGLWMSLFLLVAAGAPVVDGLFGHTDKVVAHWEAEGGSQCPPVHSTDDCQLCQNVVGARALLSAAIALNVPAAERAPREATEARAASQLVLLEAHAPRGPPLA